MKKISYNLRKCMSANLLSSCIHWYFSKVFILLPTPAKLVEMFYRMLIGGFSCVNTCWAFNSKILLSKKKLNLIYKIRNPETNIYKYKRFVSKVLKVDENNQYGNAMTKPLPTSIIKRMKKIPSYIELDLIIQTISDEDKIGYIFFVDNEFNTKYWRLFLERKKCFRRRFVFQLFDATKLNDKGTLNQDNGQNTLSNEPKKIITLYAEHLHFLLNRCGRFVTRIY